MIDQITHWAFVGLLVMLLALGALASLWDWHWERSRRRRRYVRRVR